VKKQLPPPEERSAEQRKKRHKLDDQGNPQKDQPRKPNNHKPFRGPLISRV
jgi:hypothetical protein